MQPALNVAILPNIYAAIERNICGATAVLQATDWVVVDTRCIVQLASRDGQIRFLSASGQLDGGLLFDKRLEAIELARRWNARLSQADIDAGCSVRALPRGEAARLVIEHGKALLAALADLNLPVQPPPRAA